MNLPINLPRDPENEPCDAPKDRWAMFLGQTAPIGWAQIEPFFARGQVIHVGSSLDLVEVAVAVAEDDKSRVADWMSAGVFGLLPTEIARHWVSDTADLWGVVVTPWVLVQDRSPSDKPAA
ncbi:MAG: DUF2288 domain-containing protein [Halothiobacillus sp.]|nr:DUF2288 domain-containing protein [Halothiobacillus sp.]